MIASIVLFTYLLNKIVLNFKVFKLMAFLTFFIFLFYLLNVDFIHTNTILTLTLFWQGKITVFNGKISLLYFVRISIFRRMLLGISVSF